MDGVFVRRVELWARQATPVTLAFLIVVFGTLPWPLPAIVPKPAILVLAAVYYWVLHRPELFRPLAAFALGLVQDLLSGGALGLNAFVLLLVREAVRSQRKTLANKPFFVLWGAFAVIAAGAALVTWLCGSLYYVQLLWPETVIVQYLFGVALYPAVAWCLMRVHLAILQPA